MLASLLLLLSPYISTVYEYAPAPGQFVNVSPEYEEGDTYDDMLAKAADQLCGGPTPGMVSLGSFGGYVIFGFDHPVVNVEGQADFTVYGNALPTSSEPGIVSVSVDTNGNGIPDDEWYDLAGSEQSAPGTVRDLRIEYLRPPEGHVPVTDPDRSFVTDAEYSFWSASDGSTGYVVTNNRHTQPYWPLWLPESVGSLTFTGTLLPPNGIDRNGKGTLYDFKVYDWGYADNRPNTDPEGFNLENAVDVSGNPVRLTHADFIRVHTATNQQCGWLGESSTEVCGAEDLHPDAQLSGIGLTEAETSAWRLVTLSSGPAVECGRPMVLTLYGAEGAVRRLLRLPAGVTSLSDLPTGLHIIAGEGHAVRLIR